MTDNEKNKETTKKKLLSALGEIITEDGFEKIGVNNIASRAGVSKVLIYRYFETVDNMVIEYLSEIGFWQNFSIDFPNNENLNEFLKKTFRKQIEQLRTDAVMRKLLRWELGEKNAVIEKVRLKRESKGVTLVTIVSQMSQSPHEGVATLATIMNASISYLMLLSENSPFYNGIDIQGDKGWEQIAKGIDLLVDLWYEKMV